jgi:hypothetical protein
MTNGPFVTDEAGRLGPTTSVESRSAPLSTTAGSLNLSSRYFNNPRQAVQHLTMERAGAPAKFGSRQIASGHALLSGVSRVRSSPPLVPCCSPVMVCRPGALVPVVRKEAVVATWLGS